MMGRQSGQMSMVILDIAELIPRDHLLRKINQMVSFDFIYDLVAPYYPANGRPSVDPVSMFKMLLVGYLYGIKSERRLVQEIQLNIAYRWFCGFELGEKIPDHSTFSKTRVRKWNESSLFQQIFLEIVRCCMEQKLIDGKEMASGGSYIPAEVSRNSWMDIEVEVEQSMLSYLDNLDQELASQPGFKKPASHTVTKKITTSTTDPECGYIHHGSKRGVGYLMEATVDCKYGIITGVDVFPANEKESLLVLRHLERQQKQLGLSMEKVALDRGYDTGAVHRGLELLGITGYIPAIRFPNDPSKYGFSYDPQQDTFICPMGQPLVYHRLNCNKSTGKYLRCYQVQGDVCRKCTSRKTCFDTAGVRRRILASSCYPAFYRGHLRVNTPEYLYMMRKRKIWAEGSFAAMKREHNLLKIRKRGILAATEECLLSAMALNLKRMVKAIFSAMLMDKIWAENIISQPIFRLCQQVLYFTYSSDEEFKKLFFAHLSMHFLSDKKVRETEGERRSELKLLGIDERGRLSKEASVYRFVLNAETSLSEYIDSIRAMYQEIAGMNPGKRRSLEDTPFAGFNFTDPVDIDEEEREFITTTANQLGIELPNHFFDLVNLSQNMLPSTIFGGRDFSGTPDEIQKYRKVKKLHKTISDALEWTPIEKAFSDKNCLRLAVQNCGKAIDEDVELTLTINKGALLTLSEFPRFKNHEMGYLLNDCEMSVLFGIVGTAEYIEYSESKKSDVIHHSGSNRSFGLPGYIPNYSDDFEAELDNVFCYAVYPVGDDYIIKLKVDYIKHNTTVAFPSILFVKDKIPEIPYKITSKNNPDVVEGTLKVANNNLVQQGNNGLNESLF